jgi:hypothetical protein
MGMLGRIVDILNSVFAPAHKVLAIKASNWLPEQHGTSGMWEKADVLYL